MDFPKRTPQQGSPRRSPRAMRPGGATQDDENADPTSRVLAGNASPLRKKVLGERNGGGGMEAATPSPQPKPVPSPPTLTGRGAGAYDPKTNYTTPRPEFLRYDPERHREMLLRLARAAEVAAEDDRSSAFSSTAASEAVGSSVSSAPGIDSESELDDGDDEEEEVVPSGRGRWARRLFLLLVAVACSCCYIYCMNPTPFPVHSEDSLDFTGPIGNLYDASVHELDSLRLLGLGPLYMMGPEDVLKETASPIVQGGSEGVVHQYGQRVSSRNWMAIEMMGLVDMCASVQLGKSTCSIGDENSQNVDDLKENSELSEQNAALMMGSFENGAPDMSWHSIGSTSTQRIDMEGGSSGLVHQKEGEDYSNQFVPQLVSVEKAIGSAGDKMDSRMGLESKGLDPDTELWQYEQTAEAAKEICSKVKFMWSAMEPHLLRILACLSVAGLVATMFKHYPRSRKIAVPTSQQMSPLAVQLPVPTQDLSGNLEIPMQLPLPKSGPFVSFKDPVQLALSKTDPVQKLQKGDAETMKDSHGNSQYHRDNDISKPPVVHLIGEFTFGDGSRRKSIRNSNQDAGHSAHESSESLGEDVDKRLKNSSILQSPSVGRARKEEHALKGERDAMSTPLRRSGRLRNKVTSR